MLGRETTIKAAGRTDAGVNAWGQTFSFWAEGIPSLPRFVDALNRLLPRDIEIRSAKRVPDGFDARHSSCGKRYRYAFAYGSKTPFEIGTVAFLGNRTNFDADAFKEAILSFEGTHRFRNFTTKKEDVDDFVRTVRVESILVDEDHRRGEVVFFGNGFMTYMVRFMMGSAFKVALGVLPFAELKRRLESKETEVLSFKAPAEGLTLMEVAYHEDDGELS